MNKENNIKNVIQYYDKCFCNILNSLENIDDNKIKSIVILSLIDSISKEVNNYDSNGNQRKNFEEFIIQYGKDEFEYLDKIEPVTLYYHLEAENLLSIFNLDFLEEGIEYSAEQILKMTKNINKTHKIYKQHTYASLIYTYRCILMHEFASPTIRVPSNDNNESPMYIYATDYWKLYFPYGFLKKLLLVCKKKYFKECLSKNEEPFENKINYKYWYENRKNN